MAWWWEPIELGGSPLRCRLAELTLWAQPLSGELRLSVQREPDDEAMRSEPPSITEVDEIPEGLPVRRFAVERALRLTLLPRLLDMAVVVRPALPLALPPAQEVSLFVTTPLTIAVGLDGTSVTEVSVSDPRLTWFGPSPVVGELCYSSRTLATRVREELPRRPMRALTELKLSNASKHTMEIERVRLPVPQLALAYDEVRSQLVTAALRLTREEDRDAGEIRIESLDKELRMVSPPRVAAARSWNDAFAALWS